MSYLSRNRSTIGAKDTKSLEHVSFINPDVLYPALSNVMADGSTALSAVTTGPNDSTVASSKYGTVQADGRMYYYTDIPGSKPIKDPRIGAHFGTQRHRCTSLQRLEQETAMVVDTDGRQNIYSFDGREWLRAWGKNFDDADRNAAEGESILLNPSTANDWVELTGYFNNVNIQVLCLSNSANDVNIYLNGADTGNNFSTRTTVNGILFNQSRFVNAGSWVNLNIGTITTPGINTLRIGGTTTYWYFYAFELIAQDETSTANKHKIQIPSQNVVSYGKKFTVAGTPHYNPFATKGDDSASTIPNNTTGDSVATGWTGSTSSYWDSSLDTATSLGLGAWESGGNYYRPVNGGRVVKWVDSTGVIKTSVNMMPPEAHSINVQDAGLNPATGTHNWSTKYLPSFGNSLVGSDLAVNGDFSSTTGWTLEVAQYTFSGNTCIAASVANHQMVYRQIQTLIVPGRKYKLLWTASAVTGGSFDAYVWGGGAPTVIGNSITSAGASSVIFEGGDGVTLQYIALRAVGTSSGVFTSVTFHEISDAEAQAEVAKTFHWREFGNGAANLGTTGTFADASMLNTTADDISYVMDDGLTSLSGDNIKQNNQGNHERMIPNGDGDPYFITFIGTGVSYKSSASSGSTAFNNIDVAQNLPYGTHILKVVREDTGAYAILTIDGVTLTSTADSYYAVLDGFVTFSQPKMPPIPKGAVVIADYMLMADFVSQGTGTQGIQYVAKGVRRVDCSRDFFYDDTAGSGSFTFTQGYPAVSGGMRIEASASISSGDLIATLPYFGTVAQWDGLNPTLKCGSISEYINSTNLGTRTDGAENTTWGTIVTHANAPVLGLNGFKCGSGSNLGDTDFVVIALDIATPIHTSSHYQPFETNQVFELLGGDRNIEQTNLVVTPDGQTWDEVTRDTRYMGNVVLNGVRTGTDTGSGVTLIEEWRGTDYSAYRPIGNKDFAIAYDKVMCLRTGQYAIRCYTIAAANASDSGHAHIYINDLVRAYGHVGASDRSQVMNYIQVYLEKGDTVATKGLYYGSYEFSGYWIERI